MHFLIGFIVGGGAGFWAYGKAMHATASNVKTSLAVAGVVGGIVFIVLFTLSQIFLPS
jgi:hypothetical protein